MKTVNATAVRASGLGVPSQPRLLDQVRARIRVLHYSIRTEQAHVDWIKRYILFFDKQHPRGLLAEHLERFLSHLAVERNVAASTQNQAKSALLFLYKGVLGARVAVAGERHAGAGPKCLPLVLTRGQVERVLARLPAGVRVRAGTRHSLLRRHSQQSGVAVSR